MDLLSGQGGSLLIRSQEGSGRLAISAPGGNGNKFPFGIPQGSELASEHAARVDIDRAIEPFRLRHGSVAIDDHRRAAIFGRPIVAHGKAELVCLARRLAVKSKIANSPRTAPLHLLLQSRMCHDHPSVVEHVMADEPVEKLGQ